MKKYLYIFMAGILVLLVGCNSETNSGRNFNNQITVNDVLQSGIAQANEESTNSTMESAITEEATTSSNKSNSDESVDVDLTAMSSTVVYSEVYNMMSMPENYIGKTVKMSGIFSATHDDSTDKDYYACIIKDATACCAQGIEFILEDGYEYPEVGDTVCVIGIFDTYNEGQFRYSTLRKAKLA